MQKKSVKNHLHVELSPPPYYDGSYHLTREVQMKILCFGELLFDHIEGDYYLGGAPNNFAGHSAQLGSKTYMVSAVGDDELGKRARKAAVKHGIRDDYLKVNPSYTTGIVEVTLKDGIPEYDIAQSAWDHITLSSQDMKRLKQEHFDLFYFGSLAQRHPENAKLARSLMEELRYDDAFFDVNLRQDHYSVEIIKESLTYTTILKLNDEELVVISQMLYGRQIEQKQFYQQVSRDFDIPIMLLTCGKDGSYYYTPDQSGHILPSQVKVVDTVGAGDSFSAGFIRVYKAGGSVRQAVEFATALADFVVSRQGALPDYNDAIFERLSQILG
jgi:fructokinase